MPIPSFIPIPAAAPVLLAATETVRHRVTSALVDGFSQWWQMPALLLGMAAAAAFVIWAYRRDSGELPWPLRILLATLRLGALAAVAAALLDFERMTEHEIVFPSRVAVLVDTSASMTLADESPGDAATRAAATGPAATRAALAVEALDAGGLLEALRATHEVSIWRFEADAERIAVLPAGKGGADAPPAAGSEGGSESREDGGPGWRERLVPSGAETRLGDALTRALDDEPADVLAGVILLSDGGHNAGSDPASAAAGLARAGIGVHPLGIGSDVLPANLRIADVVVPARVFPGDRFSVTAYLQPQGLVGRTARVEIAESSADGAADPAAVRAIDVVDAALGADGDLVPVRFDVPGLATPGRRAIVVRVIPPPEDRTPADDRQVVDIEVVERVTRVLLMAGGAGREFQFMRNVLERDKSFAVDVLLGTTAGDPAAGTRSVRAAFPDTDAALADYDVVVAFDYDWRQLDPAARTRLERWVARESGGLVLVAGGISMDHWLGEPRMEAVRGLFPVDLRRPNQLGGETSFGSEKPHPLKFTRDGADAEFLWLSAGRGASETLWSEFPGVYACFEAGPPKPGATVYARVERAGASAAAESQPVYLVGQFYGSGTVLYAGSGEFWRLRAIGDSIHERITTQLMRHVSQGRLLRGSRRGRLLVDRDRFPVGASVAVRLVLPEGTTGSAAVPACRATGPEGRKIVVKLAAEPGRTDVLRGTFVASREGTWQIDVDPVAGQGDEPLSRRVQAHLPDRELAHPRLDRRLLEQLAATTGGSPHFLGSSGWDVARSRALAASIPDRSRRDYEPGVADLDFKQRLNTALLGAGAGLLCLEWIIRRLVRLA